MKRTFTSILLSALLAQSAELPVRTVVLYKHGVGFFERNGTLGPGESARLDFNATEMNDVLKSLTIQERGGGKISGLRYDSMDPLGHKLSEFPFHVGDHQPLSATLDQLKGARVEMKFGSETVAGVIVNGRMQPASDKQPEREQLTLLLDSGEMRTVDMSAATGIRFPDAQLQRQFKEYFEALSAARSKDKRSVYIDSSDAKSREVLASYMIPTPVWKSSYRLIMGTQAKPTLEGWAIIDNTTGEDWTKVQLSLVSGRPISFVSQLYAPKYVTRPEAELADDASAAPIVHQGSYEAAKPKAVGSVGGAPGGGGGGRGGRGGANFATMEQFARLSKDAVEMSAEAAPMAPPKPMMMDNSSVQVDTAAGELGELFEYKISHPVTIRKNESALLPFLQQAIESRKLLIYSARGSEHPTNAAELTNNTGKTLDGGPITVYDGGVYGGEALMETLKAGDKRLISYAVDLGTRITEAFGSKQAVTREIHAVHGIITSKLAAEETRTYTVKNVDPKAKTLIIEHPLRYGYTLLSKAPAEKTASAYRFEVPVTANSEQAFAVAEERVYDESYAVSNMTPDMILNYVRNVTMTDAAKRQLQSIADQKNRIVENDRALQDAQTQVNDLTNDENRIRQNIQSLYNVANNQQQVQNYAHQLDLHEQQLATLRDQQADLQKKKSTMSAELNRLIVALSF